MKKWTAMYWFAHKAVIRGWNQQCMKQFANWSLRLRNPPGGNSLHISPISPYVSSCFTYCFPSFFGFPSIFWYFPCFPGCFFQFPILGLTILCMAIPDISSSNENMSNMARVSRLSFPFLWLWFEWQFIKMNSLWHKEIIENTGFPRKFTHKFTINIQRLCGEKKLWCRVSHGELYNNN